MAFYCESMDRTVFMYFIRHPDKSLTYQPHLWNRQANIHEWLEGYRHVIAITLRAFYSAFELAMHEIYDDGLTAFKMILP